MKRFLCIVLALAMCLSLAACGGQDTQEPTDSSAPSGGETQGTENKNETDTLTVSLSTELQTLSIYGQQNIVTNQVLTNIYDGLLMLDQDANLSPNIAESWDWDEENLKYTFHIRDDIKFHDGSDLKASDVAFSFNLIKEEYADYQATVAAQVDHVEVIDDYTIDVYLTAPSATFLYYCAIYVKIYCEAAWESTNGFTEGIVASGPYKLVSYDPTTGVELEAFEDYFAGAPAIKHVKFNIIPDGNTQVLALQSGELNISRDFPASSITTIENDSNLDIYSHSCGMVYFLQFNLRDNTIEPLKNVKVRQAINYCLDKQFMVDVAEEGLGTIANSIANQNMFGYDDEVPGYEYNVEKALELMKEAGYEDGFDIGTIYCREGKDENVAEIARENLAAIGITATVTLLETNAFLDAMKNGNFTIAATHLNLNTDAGQTFEVSSIRGSVPYSGLEDPYIESQRDAQDMEMDEDARWTILHDTLVYLSEQAYFAPCYYPTMSYAHTAGLVFNGYDPFVGLQLRFLSWE